MSMFNFLFDGSISQNISAAGERFVNYAAPVQSQTQQYQLAIQHHRNDEVAIIAHLLFSIFGSLFFILKYVCPIYVTQVRHFMQSADTQLGNVSDCGLAHIHVACRFNNQLILELVISQGMCLV